MSISLCTGYRPFPRSKRNTALHDAVANDEYETVLELLSRPENDLDKQNAFGDTPLMYALNTNNNRCTLALIDHGCDVNISNKMQRTALHFAAVRRDDSFTHKLIEKGANINAKDSSGDTPLHLAVSLWRIHNVHVLLYYGASADEQNQRGQIPFVMVLGGISFDSDEIRRDILLLLINYVVDFNVREYLDITPLYEATRRGSPVALDIINKGANVNQTVDGSHCIYSSLRHYSDGKVFRAIWHRLNVNILLKIEYLRQISFLRVFFCESRFTSSDFLKCLYMIFESPKIDVFVECLYLEDGNQTEDLIYHISNKHFRKHDQNEELKVASLLLEHGFEIYFRDVAYLYEKYGFNTCVELLLNNGSTIHQSESVTDYSISYKKLNVQLIASKLCYDNFDIYSTVQDTKLEVHKNEIRRFRKFYKAHFDCDETRNLKNSNSSNRFYTVREVPSLVQLSRDLIRSVLYKKFSTIDFFRVYQKISYLRVPETIKDIIRLKRPIYIIEDEEL